MTLVSQSYFASLHFNVLCLIKNPAYVTTLDFKEEQTHFLSL